MIEINTQKAPKALGAYSQAVTSGDFVFCSGQIGIDPDSGSLVSESVKEQAGQVMDNLDKVLEAAGVSRKQVVKVEIYLVNMEDFQEVNEVYAEKFQSQPKPARITVGVASLPKQALVEMTYTAYKG